MKDKVLSFCLAFGILLFAIYINTGIDKDSNKEYRKLSSHDILSDENLLKSFNSGISIKDIGDLVIIEQKPNATVIIDKNDLDEIIAFLNNSNTSE